LLRRLRGRIGTESVRLRCWLALLGMQGEAPRKW
jgi:hypothetical protein